MKKFKALSAFIVLFSALAFTSCDTEPVDSELIGNNPENPNPNNPNPNNPNNPNNPATGVFQVEYDGQMRVATMSQAIVNEEYIALTGMMPDGGFIQITVPQAAPGTYTLPATAPTTVEDLVVAAYQPPTSGASAFVASSDVWGEYANFPNYTNTLQVVITSVDMVNETVTGTFQFTGARFTNMTPPFELETKVFTNGSFSLSFAEDVPTPTDNTFFAKLNGADFIPTNIMGYEAMDLITVVGRRGPVENIGISVPNDVTPGTYELSGFIGDYKALYILDDSTSGMFGAESGTLVITSHDPVARKISGTFFFTATMFGQTAVHEITEGSFDVGY